MPRPILSLAFFFLAVFSWYALQGCKATSSVAPLAPTPTPTATSIPVTIYCGRQGNANGQFKQPAGIAISPSDYLYVCDDENYRIQEFGLDCNFIRTWGSLGSGDGQFYDDGYGSDGPVGVDCDANGNVFVADFLNSVQKFDSTGQFIKKIVRTDTQCLSVDRSTGHVFCACTTSVFHYDNDLNLVASWGVTGSADDQFHQINSIVVDSTNHWIYFGDMQGCRIKKFDTSGNFITCFGGSAAVTQVTSCATALTLDPSGNVYISDLADLRIDRYSPSGSHLMTWTFTNIGPVGLAIDSTGWLYISDVLGRIVKIMSNGGGLPKPDTGL